MGFDNQKKSVLSRLDKSKKGSIDKPIKSLVELINSLNDYYTSSSCSGRIMLIEVSETRKKNESNWLFVKHSKVNFKEISPALMNVSKKSVWFRQESFIMHICCRDLDSGKIMLQLCHEAGIKRAGIIAIGKRVMIELIGTGWIDTIVSKKGILLVTDDYLKVLIKEANKKHEKNLERIKKLYNKIKSIKNK